MSDTAPESQQRPDGRVGQDDRLVGMAELEALWADLESKGILYNGMTSVALGERYGDRVYHVPGAGWFVRPAEEGFARSDLSQ